MIRGDEDLFSVMNEMLLVEGGSNNDNNTGGQGHDVVGDSSSRRNNSDRSSNHQVIGNEQGHYEQKSQIRLLPQIHGYGDDEVILSFMRGENTSHGRNENDIIDNNNSPIWNPYVCVEEYNSERTAPALPSSLLLPTNPDIEVARRRVYEKFKTAFYANFEWIVGKNNVNNTKVGKANDDSEDILYQQLWNQIPPHNILERFHFASKLEESIRIVKNRESNDNEDDTNSSTSSDINQQYHIPHNHDQNINDLYSINQIRLLLINQKGNDNSKKNSGGKGNNGTTYNRRMDPILLSSLSFNRGNSYKNNKSNANIRRKRDSTTNQPLLVEAQKNQDMFDLLRNEILFQFRREWKKKLFSKQRTNNSDEAGNKSVNAEKNLNEYFTSTKFQQICKKIAKNIKKLSFEMEQEFMTQISSKASELARRASSSSSSTKHSLKKQRKRIGVPKVSLVELEQRPSSNLSVSRAAGDGYVKEVMEVTYAGLSFRISAPHFRKLQILFDRNITKSTTLSQHKERFHKALFSSLCRYDMLEGGGLQSALSGNVFDVLLQRLHCNMECFASPFNCRYERYCSAFPDTDTCFGSIGSFFDFKFESLTNGGCFQANPPFAADFILAMHSRMEALLSNGDVSAPFMFIVFIPAWTYSTGWQALSQSPSLTKSILLSQKDDPHYYCEGTQHRKLKERYRVASFDTSVFFLQNSAAKRKWLVTDEIVQEIKDAFSKNPDEEVVMKAKIDKKPNHAKRKDTIQTQKEPVTNTSYTKVSRTAQKRKGVGSSKKNSKKKKRLVDDSKDHLEILSSISISQSRVKSSKNNVANSSKISNKLKRKN